MHIVFLSLIGWEDLRQHLREEKHAESSCVMGCLFVTDKTVVGLLIFENFTGWICILVMDDMDKKNYKIDKCIGIFYRLLEQ